MHKKRGRFFVVKNVHFWHSTFLHSLENSKNPIVGRPIVAGYNWILTPASIFVGHYLKEFYSKFESFLTDSLSLIKLLENTFFDKYYFLFTIHFKNLYTNISVKDAIKIIKELFFRYQNVIPNAHFILELMELNCARMKFQNCAI